jgi:uncharacterized protein (DUF302 family)
MATCEIIDQRFSVTSPKNFLGVLAAIDAKIGHPDMTAFRNATTAARNPAELKQVVQAALGPSGFMEFIRFDLGDILRKEQGAQTRQVLRIVIGNPLIMKELVKLTPDAGSYTPLTVLIDERHDGIHISYDRMASFLAPYGNEESLKLARELDAKVEALLMAAAG